MRRGAEEEAMLSLNFSKFVSLHYTFESCGCHIAALAIVTLHCRY